MIFKVVSNLGHSIILREPLILPCCLSRVLPVIELLPLGPLALRLPVQMITDSCSPLPAVFAQGLGKQIHMGSPFWLGILSGTLSNAISKCKWMTPTQPPLPTHSVVPLQELQQILDL